MFFYHSDGFTCRLSRSSKSTNYIACLIEGILYGEALVLINGSPEALMVDAKVIIMDEPTVAVDPQSRNKILEGIEELNAKGATIIYTSHYMEEVEQICTRIAIMDSGKNLAIGTTAELKKMIKNTETIDIEVLNLPEEILKEIENLPHVYNHTYENNLLKVFYNGGKHNLTRISKTYK